jgi:hypothetical protein
MAGRDKNEVGSAYVTIEARLAGAEQELRKLREEFSETSQEIDRTGSEMGRKLEDSANKVTTTAGKMASETTSANRQASSSFADAAINVQSSVSKQVGAITGLIGAMTAVVGVATLFYNIGKKIGDVLFDTTPKVERYKAELDKLPDSYKRLAASAQGAMASVIGSAADGSAELKRAMDGLSVLTGKTLQENIQNAALIEDKFNRIAARQFEFTKNADGSFMSGSDLIRERAKDDERILVESVNRIKGIYSDLLDQQEESQGARANEAIENMVQSLRDAFDPAGDAVDTIYDRLDGLVADLREATKDSSEELRAAAQSAIAEAYREADAAASMILREQAEKRSQDLRNEIEKLTTEGLEPLEREILAKERRLQEVRELALIDDNPQLDTIASLLESGIQDLKKEQAQANKELPEKIGKAVEDGTRRVLESTGLLATAQTLAAIRTNADLILSETRRLGN